MSLSSFSAKFFHQCPSSMSLSVCVLSRFSRVQLFATRLLCPWDFPGKNTGVGSHALFQGIFPTQGSNSQFLRLLRCRRILYSWATGEPLSMFIGDQSYCMSDRLPPHHMISFCWYFYEVRTGYEHDSFEHKHLHTQRTPSSFLLRWSKQTALYLQLIAVPTI